MVGGFTADRRSTAPPNEAALMSARTGKSKRRPAVPAVVHVRFERHASPLIVTTSVPAFSRRPSCDKLPWRDLGIARRFPHPPPVSAFCGIFAAGRDRFSTSIPPAYVANTTSRRSSRCGRAYPPASVVLYATGGASWISSHWKRLHLARPELDGQMVSPMSHPRQLSELCCFILCRRAGFALFRNSQT